MNTLQEIFFHLDNGDSVGATLYDQRGQIMPQVVFKVRPEHKINFSMSIEEHPRQWPVTPSKMFGSPLEAFDWMVARVSEFSAMNSYRVTRVENIAPATTLPLEDQRSHIQTLGLDWPVEPDGKE